MQISLRAPGRLYHGTQWSSKPEVVGGVAFGSDQQGTCLCVYLSLCDSQSHGLTCSLIAVCVYT